MQSLLHVLTLSLLYGMTAAFFSPPNSNNGILSAHIPATTAATVTPRPASTCPIVPPPLPSSCKDEADDVCEDRRPLALSSRRTFATIVLQSLATLMGGSTVEAKGEPGTKDDSAFQACMGKCIYFCTKPKGAEQKSRGECVPECKQECAKTAKQLFTPGKS